MIRTYSQTTNPSTKRKNRTYSKVYNCQIASIYQLTVGKLLISRCRNEQLYLEAYFGRVMADFRFNGFYDNQCFFVKHTSQIVSKIC